MCRHLAWLGAPRSLSDLVLEQPHGLLVQSYAPRRQRHGLMNADGWGVGFFAAERKQPARWRSSRPLWADPSFASVAPVLSAGCVLAAVRSATAGMPLDETAAAPFQSGRWLMSHNGVVDRAILGPHPDAESVCDSAQLAAHLFDYGPERTAEFVANLGRRDPGARLNVLLTDGHQIIATRWHDTLSYLRRDDGVVVASEPYDDDPRWADVPEHHLVEVSGDTVTLTELEA
ncbi:MAG TPA: ergothioneine biosynthesis protein EgtC [Streptosporangiaceae bacterium]|nr:ergothioneine biosynthesis protein EgtC [Streptosporangiaceae bacterium]